MTQEQKDNLAKYANELYEKLKPVIDAISEIYKSIVNTFIAIYKELKKFLDKKINIRTKRFKKGNKYIHKYKHIKLWKYLLQIKV